MISAAGHKSVDEFSFPFFNHIFYVSMLKFDVSDFLEVERRL